MLFGILRNTHIGVWFLAVAFAMLSPGIALAGSAAQSIAPVTLRLGPGVKYPIAGSLAEAVAVDVQRCQRRWCLVQSGHSRGWTSIEGLSFGTYPRGPLSGPKLYRKSHGAGTICFHTGPDFTGESVCAKTGMVVPDLALYGYDNAFASVSVHGEISAHVCSEFNFGAYCKTIIADQPRLDRLLYRAISSYRVW